MIDEFQDTSKIQWDNFLPLLSDSVANGGTNLIVGDPKQSIYRWRNGDYSIIENVKNHAELYPGNISMDTNYRSFNNVIKFNNAIFWSCIPYIPNGDSDISKQIKNIYEESNQKFIDQGEGYVKYQIVEKEENEKSDDKILGVMVEQIKELKKIGIEEKNIAILVRTNNETAKIAKFLSDMKEDGTLQKMSSILCPVKHSVSTIL
jgi:ATP-dependent exoDNAse (exonuclease V) beta subunit